MNRLRENILDFLDILAQLPLLRSPECTERRSCRQLHLGIGNVCVFFSLSGILQALRTGDIVYFLTQAPPLL